jgi:hypothetical protein
VSLGIKRLLAFGDSKVIIEQVNKEWDRVKDTMDAYCAKIRKLEGHFEGIEFQHVPRNNNMAADVLSKLGSRRALVPAGVFIQDLRKPSIKLLNLDNLEPPQHDQTPTPPRDVLMIEKEDDWCKPFIDFIKAASTGVLMKCILRLEGLQLRAEIHSGKCGYHATSTNLVGNVY